MLVKTQKNIFSFLILLASITAVCPASDFPIEYCITDMEGSLPSLWNGRPEVTAGLQLDQDNYHSATQAVKLTWDFSKCSDSGMSFSCIMLNQSLPGDVQSIKMWVCAQQDLIGKSITLWIDDAGKERYIIGDSIKQSGWHQLVFSCKDINPAWESGDKNNRIDYPLTLSGVTVAREDEKYTKGTLFIDDIEAASVVHNPKDAVISYLKSKRQNNIFWYEQPSFTFEVNNFSDQTWKDLKLEYSIKDKFYDTAVSQNKMPLPALNPQSPHIQELTTNLPFGLFEMTWHLKDPNCLIASGVIEFSRFNLPCLGMKDTAQRLYIQKTSPFGGVFWQATPELAGKTGARWIRSGSIYQHWGTVEKQKGIYDIQGLEQEIDSYGAEGIQTVLFQTLYNKPDFYVTQDPYFAFAYGRYLKAISSQLKGKVNWFELGNEDNGITKSIYSEIARHGAAAIRAANSQAVISNSGTAYVDETWLRWQAQRGLFNWMDMISVHPYTDQFKQSPESFGVFEQLNNINRLVDDLGGFKRFITTEFGWSENGPQKDIACFIPREFMLGVAAGLDKHGLYAYDGHYGIYSNGRPRLQAVSMQAMAKLLEGHKFAGTLENKNGLFVLVWEKFGKPIAAVWSSGDDQPWQTKADPNVKVLDIFGNETNPGIHNGILNITASAAPQYIIGLPGSITDMAWESQALKLRSRLEGNLAQSGLTQDNIMHKLLLADNPDITAIWKELPNIPFDNSKTSAVGANMLRLSTLLSRSGNITLANIDKAPTDSFASDAKQKLQQDCNEGLDRPALRWVLTEYEALQLERNFAIAQNHAEFANRLYTAQAILAKYARDFLWGSDCVNFVAAWPYLYYMEPESSKINERLPFLPGSTTRIAARVNSYVNKEYNGVLRLELPQGWSSEPQSIEITIQPEKTNEVYFDVYCSPALSSEKPIIKAVLEIPNKPVVVINFDDIKITPAITAKFMPVMDLLNREPLNVEIINSEAKPALGTLKIYQTNSDTMLAEQSFSLPGHGRQKFPLDLNQISQTAKPILKTEIELQDGRKFADEQKIEFFAVLRTDTAPVIDGSLSEWTDALPLYLDKAEYDCNSFGGNWTADDLSAISFLKWDNDNLYFAAVVTDQTFNQMMDGETVWLHDSIQIAIARDDAKSRTEFAFAHTPNGDIAFRWGKTNEIVDDIQIKVVPQQGQTVYEVAIPWSQIPAIGPVANGTKLRYAILINDDDAIVPRRWLERFKDSIAHSKEVDNYGIIKFIEK